MKQNGTTLNILLKDDKLILKDLDIDEIGDNHISTGIETPMREDAFEMTDPQKILEIEYHFRAIMQTLGLDLTDDSLKGTPGSKDVCERDILGA